jgi:hypothetical protein
MGYFKIKCFLIGSCIFILSCRKNEAYDVLVNGNIRNNCTGKPFKDITVFLTYNKNYVSTQSDQYGNFNFGSVSVRPKDKYKYRLGIPGISNPDYEIYGITVDLSKEEIANFHQFGISASFKVLHLAFPSTYTYNANDSIDLVYSTNLKIL